MKKYTIAKINDEIIGKRVLPKDLKELTIHILPTDAGITLYFEPNVNEIKAYVCFLQEEENFLDKAFKMASDVKAKVSERKIPVIIEGEEEIQNFIIEQEAKINFSKQVLKKIKELTKTKEE